MNPAAESGGNSRIGLAPEQFDAAFPFHLAINRDLGIAQAGHSLRRVCPDAAPGVPLAEVFSLKRPEIPLTFDALRAAVKAVCLWRHHGSGLVFRGQILPVRSGECLAFLWSPWLSNSAELARHGLALDDFALHDPIVDLLQVLQAHETAFQDLRRLTTKLTAQRAELRKTNEELNRQCRLFAEAQAQLQHKEAETRKLALIASLTDNAVVLTDALGRVEWVNDGFVRITGYTLEDMLGKTPGGVLQGDKTDSATVAYIRSQLRKGEGFTAQLLNYAKSGREYWVHIEVQPIRDELGRLTNFMAIERDITQRRQVEQALRQAKQEAEAASQAKSAFLAAMSHEIRSPMNAVLGTLELLRSSDLDPEQQLWTRTSYESAYALLKIIDDILDFSKIEAGKLVLQNVSFRLEPLLNDIVLLFRPRTESKALALNLAMAPETPGNLVGDPFRLRQILVNLIGNAVKFTDRGGIEVGVAPVDRDAAGVCLEFHVKDTGIGIPPEAAAFLFQEFVQFGSESPRHYGGTGLGLAICKRLAELMGGEIGVDSAPGRGSDFWFRVRLAVDPVAAVDALACDDADIRWDRPAGKFGRILLAEDGEVNRLVIITMLDKAGYEVEAAQDGLAAVEAVGRGNYDLVLMDVQMPVMDGLQATRAIRALPEPRARIPIVALTANALTENRDACLAAGMDDFITKPVNRKRLLDCVSQWLRDPAPPGGASPGSDATEAGLPPLLEREQLRSLAEDTDEDIMRQTVGVFFEECDSRRPRMAVAAEARNWAALGTESHTLKSGAQLIGALRLAETAEALEDACRRGETARVLELAERIGPLMEQTRRAYGMVIGLDSSG